MLDTLPEAFNDDKLKELSQLSNKEISEIAKQVSSAMVKSVSNNPILWQVLYEIHKKVDADIKRRKDLIDPNEIAKHFGIKL